MMFEEHTVAPLEQMCLAHACHARGSTGSAAAMQVRALQTLPHLNLVVGHLTDVDGHGQR
eukprot:1145510-Pelagomonas_calceolata.AAC.5